jgi:hypothetical protein
VRVKKRKRRIEAMMKMRRRTIEVMRWRRKMREETTRKTPTETRVTVTMRHTTMRQTRTTRTKELASRWWTPWQLKAPKQGGHVENACSSSENAISIAIFAEGALITSM